MSLFDALVDEALANQPGLAPLRAVVEKELLHHDILREMSAAGLLAGLTFFGGTCLRACYGSNRLSEDLDFTGGADFSRDQLADLGQVLEERLQVKYDLAVTVSEPVRDTTNVDTWKLRIVTRPERRDLPMQRINLDICAIPSYQPRPMVMRNFYGVDMGTLGLIINVQSREEILVDKLVAFALRPNRMKNRDLWDIAWLIQQGVSMQWALLPLKVADHGCEKANFSERLAERSAALVNDSTLREGFQKEMQRFLPPDVVIETIENPSFWQYLATLVADQASQAELYLKG